MKTHAMVMVLAMLVVACGGDKPVRTAKFEGQGWDTKANELKDKRPRRLIGAVTHLVVKQSDVRTHPTFLKVVQPIVKELGNSPGLVGYGTRSTWDLTDEWTFSVWESMDDMVRFASSDAHLDGVEAMDKLGATATVGSWEMDSSELPMAWDTVLQRLDSVGRDGFGNRQYHRD